MAKSFDKMTKDELLQYKKEVEQKLKEKEEAELLIANQCKQIGFTSLMRQAKTDSVLAKKMVEALNKELSANEKKRLQNVIDELNSFIPAEPVKDEKENLYFSTESLVVYPIIKGIPCLRKENAILASKYEI